MWTHRNKLQWNFNRSSYIFIKKNAFENVVRKMAATLSRPQCVIASTKLGCLPLACLYNAKTNPAHRGWAWKKDFKYPSTITVIIQTQTKNPHVRDINKTTTSIRSQHGCSSTTLIQKIIKTFQNGYIGRNVCNKEFTANNQWSQINFILRKNISNRAIFLFRKSIVMVLTSLTLLLALVPKELEAFIPP